MWNYGQRCSMERSERPTCHETVNVKRLGSSKSSGLALGLPGSESIRQLAPAPCGTGPRRRGHTSVLAYLCEIKGFGLVIRCELEYGISTFDSVYHERTTLRLCTYFGRNARASSLEEKHCCERGPFSDCDADYSVCPVSAVEICGTVVADYSKLWNPLITKFFLVEFSRSKLFPSKLPRFRRRKGLLTLSDPGSRLRPAWTLMRGRRALNGRMGPWGRHSRKTTN